MKDSRTLASLWHSVQLTCSFVVGKHANTDHRQQPKVQFSDRSSSTIRPKFTQEFSYPKLARLHTFIKDLNFRNLCNLNAVLDLESHRPTRASRTCISVNACKKKWVRPRQVIVLTTGRCVICGGPPRKTFRRKFEVARFPLVLVLPAHLLQLAFHDHVPCG